MSTRLFAVFRVAAELTLLFAALISFPCAAQTDWGTPAQEEALARARVDLRRSQIGLPALPLNVQLEAAARGHANYITINNLSGGHFQNEAQFSNGFTGNTPSDRIKSAGYVAVPDSRGSSALSTGEVVARGSMHGETAVDTLIQAIYHRVGIFGTSFDEQGAGVGQNSQGITVINFGSRKYPQPKAPTGWVGIYPFEGQSGIPVDFYSDEESPDPIPNLNRVGYPVSLHIDGTRVLTVTSFTIAPVNAAGTALQSLPVQLLSTASGDTHIPASVAAIVPLTVLQYGTVYEASFIGTADGAPLAKSWRFTTAPYSTLAITGPTTAYVGDSLALKFSGGSGRYVNVGYNYTAPAGQGVPLSQAAWIGDNGYGFHVDGLATISVTVTDGENATATLSIALKSAAERPLVPATTTTTTTTSTSTTTVTSVTTTTLSTARIHLEQGWNLIGAGGQSSFDVATFFANIAKVSTVWKWLADRSQWAFYTPQLDATALQTYADAKGYKVLSTIEGREGFWVNTLAAHDVELPFASPYAAVDHRASLLSGWNLVSVGEQLSPVRFNNYLTPYSGDVPPAIGSATTTTVYQVNLTTLWAWNTATSGWLFYAPTLDTDGKLVAYATSKGYLDFTTSGKTLGPGVGFWVNR
jgi:uncharacterized protein YkwD